MIILAVRYQCKEGTAALVQELLGEMITLVQQEQGCVHYVVSRSTSDEDEFFIFEQYDNEDALQFHTQTEYYRRIVSQIALLLEKRERNFYVPVCER